jgi:hypothetical protein
MQKLQINFSIDKVDLLEYQLYSASKSATVRKAAFKSRYYISIINVIMGFIFLFLKIITLGLFVLGAGIVW